MDKLIKVIIQVWYREINQRKLPNTDRSRNHISKRVTKFLSHSCISVLELLNLLC